MILIVILILIVIRFGLCLFMILLRLALHTQRRRWSSHSNQSQTHWRVVVEIQTTAQMNTISRTLLPPTHTTTTKNKSISIAIQLVALMSGPHQQNRFGVLQHARFVCVVLKDAHFVTRTHYNANAKEKKRAQAKRDFGI